MSARENELSRRRLFQLVGLGAVGATGAVPLAGCSQAEPESEGGAFHGAYPYILPPDGHYNRGGGPYAPMPQYVLDGPYCDLMYLPGAAYHWEAKKWEYYLAESSEFAEDGSTFTVKVREGLTWSNGDALTSEDFMTTLYIARIQNSPVWASIDKIEAPDKQTFVVHLTKPSAVIDRYVLRSWIIDTATFGEFAGRAAKLAEAGDALDSKDAEALNKEFQKYRPKEIIASGPYIINKDSISDSKMTMVKNDKGYAADTVHFETIVIYNGETPQVAPLLQSKSIDYATHGFSVAQESSFAKLGYRILRPPNYSGPALFINFDKLKEFNDKRTRHALAHAINRPDNGRIALGQSGVGVKHMVGFSDIQVPDWLSAADQEKLETYPYDQAKAAELLEAVGWEKKGGSWHTPDGKKAEYLITYPSDYADWSASGDDVAGQLTKFGIKVTPKGINYEQYLSELDKGNFQMSIMSWGSSAHPHPHFSYAQDLFTHNIPVAKNQGGRGIGFELDVETDAFGRIDLEQVINDAGSGLDEAEQKANISRAAVAFNELLPIIPLFERYGNNPVLEGKRVKKFPGQKDPKIKNPVYADSFVVMGLLGGTIDPV